MKLKAKDAALEVLSYVGRGPEAGRQLMYFRGLGDPQAVRAFQYVLKKRQSTPLDFTGQGLYGATYYLARGEWRVQVEPYDLQGARVAILTAYLPKGGWVNKEWFYFVVPGEPGVWHDDLFRRWAENFTPYPIPPELSVEDVLRYRDRREYSGEESEVAVVPGVARPGVTRPYMLTFTPQALENILKEVTSAA